MKKVLVVEDSQSERELITLYLEKNNYQVIAANNAEDGMELAAKQQPDVIITDITMEGINEDKKSASTHTQLGERRRWSTRSCWWVN